MPEEPIVPVIRRPDSRRPSEDSLDRERRIAREVREGRERFERKSEDREAVENRRNKQSPAVAESASRFEFVELKIFYLCTSRVRINNNFRDVFFYKI